MACRRTHCKYYDRVKDGECEFEGNECVNKSKYISMYAKEDCVFFKNEQSASKRCSALVGTSYGAPCENPRIKKNGKPVECTFYKKCSNMEEWVDDEEQQSKQRTSI